MSNQQIGTNLDNLISLMDNYFTVIYERFPRMENALESFQEETKILLDYFIKTKGENKEADFQQELSSQENFRIAQILQEIKANTQEVDNSLLTREEIQELLQEFSSTKHEEKGNLLEIIDIAEKVDEALSDIELVSLNAIIFAAKIGDTGAPFSVIAENIKNLSLKVSKDNHQMQELTQEINPWFDGFQDNIGELMNFRDHITREHTEKVNQKFNQAIDSLGEIGSFLHDLLENVNQVLEPGRQLMSLIQQQDILRQGLENANQVINSVQEESKTVDFNHREQALNHVTYKVEATQLAQRLVEGVNSQLKQALHRIDEQLKKLNQGLKSPIEDSYYLNTFFSGYVSSVKQETGSVDHTFSEINTLVENYISVVEELNQRCYKLTSDRESMITHLESGHSILDKIEKSLKHLDRLRLLSAIELSRMNMQKHYFNSEIEKISQKVIEAVSDNRLYFEDIKKVLEAHLWRLDKAMNKSQDKISEVREVMHRAQEELEMICSIINQAINTLYVEIKNLQGEIDGLEKDFGPVWELVNKCHHLYQQMDSLLREAREEQSYYYRFYEVEDWPSQKEKISSKARQFVDYLEKMDLEDPVATKEDASEVGGELTLF